MADQERVAHVKRIKGLLALHGVRSYRPVRRDRREVLATLRTSCAEPLPARCRAEIEREVSRLELVLHHIEQVERAMLEPAPVAPAVEGGATPSEAPTPDLVTTLRPSPASGVRLPWSCPRGAVSRSPQSCSLRRAHTLPIQQWRLQHEQGISTAGNSIVRARPMQLAWRWIRFQTTSGDHGLGSWPARRAIASGADDLAIVAVARKLLIALWRYITTGVVPAGAKMRFAQA